MPFHTEHSGCSKSVEFFLDEMIGWHHRLNACEFEQALGNGEGQGRLACCRPWGNRVGHDLVTAQQHHLVPVAGFGD